MNANIAVTRITSSASGDGGDQDITIADFGTPKAALFITGVNTNDATADDGAVLSVGATDGNNHWAVCIYDTHSVGTTNSMRQGTTDEVIQIVTGGGMAAEANFKEWITDGVRITWGNYLAGRLVTVVLFTGDDLSAYANKVALSTEDTEVEVTSVGFEADALIMAHNGALFNDTEAAHGLFGLGFVKKAATIVQQSVAFASQDNVATSDIGGALMTTDVGVEAGGAAGQPTWAAMGWIADVTAFDSNGFHIYSRDKDSTGDEIGYLALKIVGGSFWVGTVDSPTSNGLPANKSVTGVGFQPDFVMLAMSMHTAIDTHETDGKPGAFGISTFTSSNQYCQTLSIEDNQSTTNTQRVSDDQAINLDDHAGVAAFDATYVSMDADGWTLNYTVADGTTRKWVGFAIGEAGHYINIGDDWKTIESLQINIGDAWKDIKALTDLQINIGDVWK